MIEKLGKIEERYNELTQKIGDPEIIANNREWKKLAKEHSDLTPIIEEYEKLKKCVNSLEEDEKLLKVEKDAEMLELLQEEIKGLKAQREQLDENLKILLLPKDANDDKNVIIEIRGGAGGDEAALFASELVRMYEMYAERHRWKTEMINYNEIELGGVKEAVFMIQGVGAYSKLKFESGVHRVQRVPETESQGRVHTSTVTVAVLPELEEVEFEILDKDLKIDTYRSSGAGGQHVNKTESAIRITHIPTGIVVACQNERSQVQNREVAMNMLRSKLIALKEEEMQNNINEIKGDLKKIEWGSQIRSYVFCPYTLVKDHRTGYEEPNVEKVMDGDIKPFILDYLKKSM